jgi:hypothetical protein
MYDDKDHFALRKDIEVKIPFLLRLKSLTAGSGERARGCGRHICDKMMMLLSHNMKRGTRINNKGR